MPRHPASAAIELSKVKFGGSPLVVKDEDDWSSASEGESDVTEPDEDASEPEYFPDAIKWARYRDSRKDRPDGIKGWHYGVMWTGYLKSFSDTEEFFGCFELDGNGHNQMLSDFWNAVDRPLRINKKGEMLEPLGSIGEVIKPPKDLISKFQAQVIGSSANNVERWVKEARPRRSHKLFKVRIEKEWSIPRQRILKRDSDYYYHKRLVERAERERVKESELVSASSSAQQGEPGPSTLASRAVPIESPARSKMAGKAIVKGKGKEVKVKEEIDPALATLFEDDEIVAVPSPEDTKKKKKKKKHKDKDGNASIGTMVPPPAKVAAVEKVRDKDKKRKRESGLPEQAAGSSTRRTSPEKKARTGTSSPKKVSQTHVIPPTPAINPLPKSITRNPSPGPSPIAPSPSPSTQGRRAGQEPLFLDSAPSPADTFGDPMPGFFDSNPGSRVLSQSHSNSQIRVKTEITYPDFEESTAGPPGVEDDMAMEEESINNALTIPEDPPSHSRTISSSLVADVTGTSTSLVAAALAAANGRSPTPAISRAVTPVASTIVNKSKSKSPIPADAPTKKPTSRESPEPAVPTNPSTIAPALPLVQAPSATGSAETATVLNEKEMRMEPSEPTEVGGPPQGDKVQAKSVNDVTQTTPIPAADSPTSDKSTASSPPRLAAAVGGNPPPAPGPSASQTGEPSTTEAVITVIASPVRESSPPMEEPVPTFSSPRKVSRSPSVPMDTSSSPLVPAEDTSQIDQAISPPRYVLSPVKAPEPVPAAPVKPPSPIRIKVPLSERPKYVQPSRIQFLNDIVDPEAAALLAKKAAKNPPPPPHAHPSLPDRPPAATSAPIHPSRLPLMEGSRASVQPRSFGAPAPSGPSGYAPRQAGPLADQKESFKTIKPPWEKRKQNTDLPGGQSPMWNAPSGPSAMRTDQWRPPAHVQSPHVAYGGQSPYAAYGAQSPAWAPNAATPVMPYGTMPPVMPGRSPMHGAYPSAPVAVDPRSGGASPALSLKSPNPAMHAQAYPQATDPRRRGSDQPGKSPGHTPMSPLADSGSTGPRRIAQLGRITAHLASPHVDGEDVQLSLNIMQGAFTGFMPEGDRVLAMVLNNKGKSNAVDMPLDEVDASLIGWQMRYGARLVQWAKVGSAGGPAAEWEQFKMRAVQRGRAWVTFTENLATDNTVVEHFAVIMTPAKFVEPSIIGLGLGPWSTVSEIGIALLVMALPLDSYPPPMLPNPVRPDLHIEEDKMKPNTFSNPMHLFASYGLTPESFRSLHHTRAVKYPGLQGHYDVMHYWIEHEFSVNDVIPYDEQHAPENVWFMNNKFTRAVKSSTLDKTVNRRTRYFSAGPALHLLPSQWKLREIWTTGGLFTFSPTFVLRHPEKVAEIMSMVRIAPNWAAYIIPQVVKWANASWKMPARCPNPTQAYQTFTQSLFLDQHLLNLSGSPAGAGGGLAVSTCPALMSYSEKCARWLEWLQQVSTATEYQTLVNLCNDHVRGGGPGKSAEINDMDLELVDIEKKQIEDLTNMRKSPHLLPYRRYIYIGEVSLQKERKERLGAGVEFVDSDSFAAIFSGTFHWYQHPEDIRGGIMQ